MMKLSCNTNETDQNGKPVLNVFELSEEELIGYHAQTHIEFSKPMGNKRLSEIILLHKSISQEMASRKMRLETKDTLDSIHCLQYAQPNPSNNGEDSWIYLKDIIHYFGDFKYREPFIFIVGGICNHGKTMGDIDILINKDEPSNPDEDMPIKFRIMRMLPRKYWDRLHFLYARNHGPFTNYIPLYTNECKIFSREVFEMQNGSCIPGVSDIQTLQSLHPFTDILQCLHRLSDEKKAEAKASANEDLIKLGRFFAMPKPRHGVTEDELYNKENFLRRFDDRLLPVMVDEKYDGMRCQIHSIGNVKRLYSDDGGDITSRFPSIIKDLPDGHYVLDSEITGRLKDKPMPRSDVAGYAHSKGAADDSQFSANVFDLIFFKEDIHKSRLDARREVLRDKFKSSKHINIVPFRTVRNRDELWSAINTILKKKLSEGVMVKSEAAKYELDGQTMKWIKYVKEWQIKAKVIEKKKVEGTESYNYLCVINDNIPVGRSYNTSVNAKVGDSILISFVNINRYTDPKTSEVWYNWWRPRVIHKATGTSSKKEADSLNKQSNSLDEEKAFPNRYKEFLEIHADLVTELNGVTTTTSIPATFRPVVAMPEKKKKKKKESIIKKCVDNIDFDGDDSDDDDDKDDESDEETKSQANDSLPESLFKDIDFDVSKPNDKQLVDDHRIIHAWIAQIKRGIDFMYSSVQIRKLHNKIVQEILKRGFKHQTPLQQLADNHDESICRRCGKCCFFKKELSTGILYMTREKCKFLDILEDGSTSCSIYQNRHNIAHWCLSIQESIEQGCLPADCPYLSDMPNYNAPLELAKEPKKDMKFAVRHHSRGRSIHADIAFERPNNTVDAYVLDDLVAKEISDPILTLTQLKREDGKPENYKINYKTGEIPSGKKILVQSKAAETRAFTEDISGVSPPGGAGATKNFPGVFNVLDKGTYDSGARKSYFFEYFIKGKVFKGRYIFRLLPRSGKWKEAGKTQLVWFFWKPKDQSPYILSNRAINKKDFETGVKSDSWLPEEIAKKVPKDLQWWNKDITKDDAVEKIKAVRKLFLKQNIIKLEKNLFVLHKHWWKGQEVIRKLPVIHWDLRFSDGFEYSSLDKNPIEHKGIINAILKEKIDVKKWIRTDDWSISPGHEGNPNKKIPAYVDTLDSGNFTIIDEVPGKKLIELYGKKLKGKFNFKQTDPESSQWIISKTTEEESISDFQIKDIMELSYENILSRREIAELIGVAKSTIYKYQKAMDLL